MSVTFVKFEGTEDQYECYLVAEQITCVQPDVDHPDTHSQIFLAFGESQAAIIAMPVAQTIEHIERTLAEQLGRRLIAEQNLYYELARQKEDEHRQQARRKKMMNDLKSKMEKSQEEMSQPSYQLEGDDHLRRAKAAEDERVRKAQEFAEKHPEEMIPKKTG